MKKEEVCAKSQRVDGKGHSFVFDGDDPYVVCAYCGERRDAISGRVIASTVQPTKMTSKETEIYERLLISSCDECVLGRYKDGSTCGGCLGTGRPSNARAAEIYGDCIGKKYV